MKRRLLFATSVLFLLSACGKRDSVVHSRNLFRFICISLFTVFSGPLNAQSLIAPPPPPPLSASTSNKYQRR